MDNYKYKVLDKKYMDGKTIYKVRDEFIKDELFYILEYKTIKYSDWDLDDKIKDELRNNRSENKILDFFDEGDFISDKKTFFVVYNENLFPYISNFKKDKRDKPIKEDKELSLKNISLKDLLIFVEKDPKRLKEIKRTLEYKIPESVSKYKDDNNVKLIILLLKWIINPDGVISKTLLFFINKLSKDDKKNLRELTHSKELQRLSSKRKEMLKYPLYKIIEEIIVTFGLPEISIILIIIKLLDELEKE